VDNGADMSALMTPDAYSLYEYLAIFAAAGFVSGFVSGFFGIGGGFVRVPLFLLVFPYVAVSGDLVMNVEGSRPA